MRFKRFLAACAAALILVPASASAAIQLTQAGQLQLAQIASQLVALFTQISAAQAQGTAYTSSPAFQVQAAGWTTQLIQLQQQLAVLLQGTIVSPTPAPSPSPTYIPTQGTGNVQCPNFYRTIGQGDSGSDVAAMQLFLARSPYAQYGGGISGIYDFGTMQAVQRFQAHYGIIAYGSPDTTGYGKVGPATRASMMSVCANSSYITTTTPITVPATPPPSPSPYPTPTPPPPVVQTNYSTGQLQLIPELTGQSGGPNSVTFRVNMLPNSACTSAAFILAFGDGQQQALSSSATCGNQIQQVSHVYANTGTYNATLSSGPFQTSLQVAIQPPNNKVTLTASQNQNVSFGANITAVYDPGVTCANGAYTINFGDGSSQSLSFSAGCATQTQTINHTYPQAGPYLISASDPQGKTVTANFTAVAIQSAGAGDPFQVLFVHGDGQNNATAFPDSSTKAHVVTGFSGAKVSTANPKIGTGAIDLSGSWISTPAGDDFNYGSGPFTVDFWFYARSFPNPGNQAALMMQAGSNAADSSLGGAGLEFFSNQLYFVGNIGNVTYHPFYNNSPHTDALTPNTWYHVALVRSGNAITMYLNGTSTQGIAVSGSANASSFPLTFGRYGDFNGNYFNGLIDEINIAKGVARWTANFDPLTRLHR